MGAAAAYDLARLKGALAGLKVEDNPAIVKQKSRDFFWYSPVLKRELDHVTADLIVSPKDETELIHALRACYELGVPVTLVSSRDRVLPGEDPDAAAVIEQVFTSRGGTLVRQARASAVRRAHDGVVVDLQDGRTVAGSARRARAATADISSPVVTSTADYRGRHGGPDGELYVA